eukprot:CAMPEP_0117443336 /NCGR_PEP_ID=MMETSP0759-20121206/4641_1 /TAXON_ID=63605 /ORGANISM="Percolomonas cosmopolitus, Strain WS" /LENGTH=1596 /DNA_ID=CAMNT_0005235305 /DNA_START=30 /DNA_END=4820 /DNA_ORIENTATION=+
MTPPSSPAAEDSAPSPVSAGESSLPEEPVLLPPIPDSVSAPVPDGNSHSEVFEGNGVTGNGVDSVPAQQPVAPHVHISSISQQNNSTRDFIASLSRQRRTKKPHVAHQLDLQQNFYAEYVIPEEEKERMMDKLRSEDPKIQQLQKLKSESSKEKSTHKNLGISNAKKKRDESDNEDDDPLLYSTGADDDDPLDNAHLMDGSHEKPSARYAFRNNRFSVREVCNRLNYLNNKRPEKHEDRIKQVIYVRDKEDGDSEKTSQLLIVFNNNIIRFRDKDYKFLDDSLDHHSKFMKVFLDPTGSHLIVCKKSRLRVQDSNYQMMCIYANLAHVEKNQDPKFVRFSLAYPKGNQYEKITSVGWNIYDSTSIETGSILIGTNKKRVYVGSVSGHLQKNRLKLNNVKKFALLRDFITEQEEVQTLRKPINGIEIHRQDIKSDEMDKKDRCFVLISSPDRFYEFNGDWYQADPYKFIQGASLESSSIYHPVGTYPSNGLCIVSDVQKMSSKKESETSLPDWTKWKKRAFITTTQSGIFHGRLKFSSSSASSDQTKGCVTDSEYLVFSENIRDRYWESDGLESRVQDIPKYPRDATATSNHVLLIVPFERSLPELVCLDIPPDVCQIPQDNGRPAVTQIVDDRVVLESVHQGIHSFASFSFHSSAANPKIYAWGADCIIEIEVKKPEKKNAWTHHLDRANAYLTVEKQRAEAGNFSQSSTQTLLGNMLCKDYYLLAYKKAKDADGANRLRALIMTSLGKYCIATGDVLQAAMWFTCSDLPVAEVIDHLTALNDPKATRFYLMLRYGYINKQHPLWQEVRSSIGEGESLRMNIIEDQLMSGDISFDSGAALEFPCITRQEAVCIIVEMFLQELNQLDEDYQKACFEGDNYMKRRLKKDISNLKNIMKRQFLNRVEEQHPQYLDKDRIYRLMISYGHTTSAVKFSNEYQDYDKVLSYHVSNSFTGNRLHDQVIKILDKLPIHESTSSQRDAEDIYVRYCAPVFKHRPEEFVNALSTKGFVNSMKFLPAVTRFGDFIRLDSNVGKHEQSDADDTDGAASKTGDPAIEAGAGKLEASPAHTIQFYLNALKHSSDVSKGRNSREDQYIYNTLIMLFTRQHSPQQFISLFKNADQNPPLCDFNFEFGLRRTQALVPKHSVMSGKSVGIRDGFNFTTFLWDITNVTKKEWTLTNDQYQIKPDRVARLSTNIRASHAAALAYYHLHLSENALRSAIESLGHFNTLIMKRKGFDNMLRDERIARDKILQLISYIANNPKTLDASPEDTTQESQSRRLWIFVVKHVSNFRNVLPELSESQVHDEKVNEFIRRTVAADLSKLLKGGSRLHLQDVLSYISPHTPIHEFSDHIADYIRDLSETESYHTLGESTDAGLKASVRNSKKEALTIANPQEAASRYHRDIEQLYSLWKCDNQSHQSDNNLLHFKCQHVFHERDIEQAITNVHQFMIRENDEISMNPLLSEGGEEATEISDGSIVPVNVNLTKVRLEQLNHRLNIYDMHANHDSKAFQTKSSFFKMLKFSDGGDNEWQKRKPYIMRRLLRRITVKTQRQTLLSKQCPLCGQMAVPSIHFGFTQPDEKENNEWFVNPREVPDFAPL